jgi:hypothetical protein
MWQAEHVPDDPQEQPQEEIVEGVVVLAPARAIEPVRPAPPPLRQVAAVAATGFVAGAATAAVLGRRHARSRRAIAPAGPVRPPATVTLDVLVVGAYVPR